MKLAILVPPSEGKAPDGSGPPWQPGTGALPALDDRRAQLLAALGPAVRDAPTLPAIERYTGVLYRELDWASLPGPAKRRGRSTLLTVSGLWGLVAPPDPIPAYRLKMSASLPATGKLSTWWRDPLTDALADHLRGRVVWDLLPIEHSAAWRPEAVVAKRRITVRFVDRRGATVSHWNKLLKGALVRQLLLAPTGDPEDLAGWRHPAGYRLDVRGSDLAGDPVALVFRER